LAYRLRLKPKERFMPFLDRATAGFLGLALGDAFGCPLEFVRGPAVRTLPVVIAPGHFNWTDDTHMALFLAEAVLAQGSDRLDDDTFGNAVGEALSRWLDDPLTPSTAPGNTCLAGARAWRATRNWRTSGVSHSDGCCAVMRVVPIGIAFAGGGKLTGAPDRFIWRRAPPATGFGCSTLRPAWSTKASPKTPRSCCPVPSFEI
jgi:ADP-ribosylglycohydrolase